MFDFFRVLYPGHRRGAGALPARYYRVKFILLTVIFLLAVFGIQAAWLMDPLVIAARFLSLNLIPSLAYAVNKLFIYVIQTFELYGDFYDFYRSLKDSFLGINIFVFSHSLLVFFSTALLIASSFVVARLWCRLLCPLGAGYGLLAQAALLKRKVGAACNGCGLCSRRCRMGAIAKDGAVYNKKECILCMDCVYDCPQKAVRFGFHHDPRPSPEGISGPGVDRRQFLFLLIGGIFSLGAKSRAAVSSVERRVIRPPAALNEGEFLDRCIRCGNCMKVCITNGLQPCLFESGFEGVWTPQLVPEIGYCEYRCTLCGHVCPTGALKPLTEEEKARTKIGLAVIDRTTCLPWAESRECIVCEEHCPISSKAIKLGRDQETGLARPYVDKDLCVGCGICQTKCPVRPVRAIRVIPEQGDAAADFLV
jgi:ferredoxin